MDCSADGGEGRIWEIGQFCMSLLNPALQICTSLCVPYLPVSEAFPFSPLSSALLSCSLVPPENTTSAEGERRKVLYDHRTQVPGVHHTQLRGNADCLPTLPLQCAICTLLSSLDASAAFSALRCDALKDPGLLAANHRYVRPAARHDRLVVSFHLQACRTQREARSAQG